MAASDRSRPIASPSRARSAEDGGDAFAARLLRVKGALLMVVGLCIGLPLPAPVHAQVFDTIDIERSDGEVQIQIRFNARVLYRRHVVSPAGNAIEIYIEEAARSEALRGVIEDTRRSPPSPLVPPFTVTYHAERAAALRRIAVTFTRPVPVTARQGADADTIVLSIAAPAAAPRPLPAPDAPAEAAPPVPPAATAPPAAPSPPVAPDIAAQAQQLLTQAKASIAGNRLDDALDTLNRLLNLPPSPASREAQELVGNVREGLGQGARARAEYELFLRLYPEGADAERVRRRLAALARIAAAAPPSGRPTRPAATSVWGSVSQYYYGGKSQIDTTTTVITPATNATVIDTQRLTANDQSALATLVDLNARYRGEDWDNRLVFRDTYLASFLKDQRSRNRLYGFYGDIRNVRLGTQARFGRLTSTGNGVLGRYDGGSLSYSPSGRWRIGVLAGTPSEETPGGRQTFVGQSLDFDNVVDGLGFGLFNIVQRAEGFIDRHALGGELRYFDQQRALFGYVDYDRTFSALNVGSLQGSWTFTAGPSFTLLYDYRRAPTLQLSNVLFGDPSNTLRGALAGRSLDDARLQLRAATPVSRVFLAGTTVPVLSNLQLGLEYRASSLSAAAANGTLPATPATGRVDAYTLQAIGTSIWGRYDVVAFTGSFLRGEANTAKLAAINPRLQFFERLRVEPSLRWYRQDDAATGVETVRITPGLRLAYSLTDRLALESEASVERSRADGPMLSETVQRLFYFVGFRWDFEGRPQANQERQPMLPLSQPRPPGDPVSTLGQPRGNP